MSGTGLKVAGIAAIVVGAILYGVLGDVEENPASLLGAFLMIVGILLHFKGRRLQARRSVRATRADQRSGPTVLYLRAFGSDTSRAGKVLQTGLSTDEEDLAEALRPIGTLVAIGQPGEPLPVPGAARMYASDQAWRAVVQDQMRTAALVVVRVGSGSGLEWECRQAFETLQPERLVLLVMNLSLNAYRRLSEDVRRTVNVSLPDIPRCSALRTIVDYRQTPLTATAGFIRFSGAWTAHFAPLPFSVVRLGYHDLVASYRQALRPVFEAVGVTDHNRPRTSGS